MLVNDQSAKESLVPKYVGTVQRTDLEGGG